MAANDYYHSFDPNGGPRREDGPLPPIPSGSPASNIRPPADSNASMHHVSPTSPFSDHAYPEYPAAAQHQPTLDTSYHGASGGQQQQGQGSLYGQPFSVPQYVSYASQQAQPPQAGLEFNYPQVRSTWALGTLQILSPLS